MVARVAAAPDASLLAAGLEDGRVWVTDLKGRKIEPVRAQKGAAISALAMSADGKRLAWGDEDGAAGVVDVPGF